MVRPDLDSKECRGKSRMEESGKEIIKPSKIIKTIETSTRHAPKTQESTPWPVSDAKASNGKVGQWGKWYASLVFKFAKMRGDRTASGDYG